MKQWGNTVTFAMLMMGSAVSLIVSANQPSPIIGWCTGALTAWTLADICMFRNKK